MISRKIEKELLTFKKDQGKHALMLTGARQVGKTYSVREFGKGNYESFVELNFLEDGGAGRIFNGASGADDVLLRLSAYAGQKMPKGRTLIFFDEVQKCPEAVTMIKFLVQKGGYHYILSGSLLGVELKGVRSFPVGAMGEETMYPLDFEEFLRACGQGEDVIGHLREAFLNCRPVDAFVHDFVMRLFRLYLVVGGMPEAVRTYLETNNIGEVRKVQRRIVQLYREDIAQYDHGNALKIKEIYDSLPSQLKKENKRFYFSAVREDSHYSRLENGFLWLTGARVAIPSYCVEAPRRPLKLERQRNVFKLYSNDLGVLGSQYQDGSPLDILSGEGDMNCGAIYENFVAQELAAHGISPNYFHSKRQGEIDFVIEFQDRVLPLEIKSGKNYRQHAALDKILALKDYGLKEGMVLCHDNMQRQGNIVYAPIYMAMFLKPFEMPDDFICRIGASPLKPKK